MNADPGEVLGLVDAALGPAARLAGAVYRESAYLDRYATAGVRRQLLALNAARFGDRELAARITSVPVEGKPDAWWEVEWATSSRIHPRFQHVLPGHADTVSAVATEVVDGRPVAVTGGLDKTVRVWDLATGRTVGEPFANGGVATAVVEGRSVAVTGRRDGTVRVWDLATGRPVGEFLTDHTGPVHVEATAVLEGRPFVVAEHDNKTLRVWDLATGRTVGEPLTGHTGRVWAVATAVVESRPVVVVADGDEMVRVWDLATGRLVGEPLTGHTESVRVVATGVVDGRPVAVTGGLDMTVRVWDLATGQPIGEPLTGHTESVWAVATGVVDGRPVAVTGSSDETVRVWDLATGQPAGPELVFPAEVGAVAVTADGRLVVGFGWEVAVLARCPSVPWTPFTAVTVPTHESRERDVQPPHPTTGDDWESSLTQAFGVLLNHPLSDFDSGAEYAAYYSGNWLYETGSDRDPVWLEPAALNGRETVTNENLLLLDEPGYPDLRFDASRSLFEIYTDAVDFPAAFQQGLAAVKLAGSDHYPQVRGSDLARLTARHGVDLTSPDLPAKTWRLTDARIASDGTLLDALRVATGIGEGPDSLVPRKETDATTEAAIAAVEHAGIRAHLRAFCDPRSDDLALCRRKSREEDSPLVAKWEGAVDQYEITVQRVEA
ncbi:WD40 repeat domain-containing protein [Streptomyces sp. PSKA54]|uniref:WD40 repeat domain-containing protein n=1 Tax=Streptomyces himalayensis subsp. aureolus TaxID=2758039 RepID=A0A7W2D8B3_9ACTN|nr:WD40 repeat domain-containing protein [Streptomyces himalayensis]MBA4866616.1 WD40 repeat domain-containing protein [Streptomyces himalayensis subsp. aureolus]